MYMNAQLNISLYMHDFQMCYLCIGLDYVALYFIHGVSAVGHSAQVQPLENHFILRQSSCTERWGTNLILCFFPHVFRT